jgi:hypothetical protein
MSSWITIEPLPGTAQCGLHEIAGPEFEVLRATL